MGSFSFLTVADYPIFENKNGYYAEIVNLLFLPEDYRIEERPFLTKNTLFWGDSFENETYTFKGFKQSVKVCKQRLEIYGYSIQKTKKEFLAIRKYAKEEGDYYFPINKITFEQYIHEISFILENKIKPNNEPNYNLRESLSSNNLGIYGQSVIGILYSVLSVLPDNQLVEYDLTDIIDGGWIDELDVTLINVEKIIILTEGKTDVEFISKSMSLLYPHLFQYYHFINFEEFKVESNASALVKLVTSFAASNIKHPIIVVFDNDTTGIMEMKKLKSVKLSSNFKILKYPDSNKAKKYPTIGPTGIKKMNVNGLACGIEMYFDKDTLTRDNIQIPIQWKGFNEKENKYQGEISLKSYVQERFREKLKSNLETDFSDIDLILKEIFNAYRK